MGKQTGETHARQCGQTRSPDQPVEYNGRTKCACYKANIDRCLLFTEDTPEHMGGKGGTRKDVRNMADSC